jgi:hypothetical protein
MTDQSTRDVAEEHGPLPENRGTAEDSACPAIPANMTLESIVDFTGELEHLNALVQLHLERSGGFRSTASYFTIVTPILDMLEVEIRVRYQDGMSRDQIKFIVRHWIDEEIEGLKNSA